MTAEQQEGVREYLLTWSDDDWEEVDRLRSAMSIPEALVEVHRMKLCASLSAADAPVASESIDLQQQELILEGTVISDLPHPVENDKTTHFALTN